MYMLDTDICSYIIKKKPESVLKRLLKIPMEEICISSITLAELRYGIARIQSKKYTQGIIDRFTDNLSIMDWNASAANSYGTLRTSLEKKGTPIGNMDLLIAAHAISIKATLVTNNQRHFTKVPGLKLENWV